MVSKNEPQRHREHRGGEVFCVSPINYGFVLVALAQPAVFH